MEADLKFNAPLGDTRHSLHKGIAPRRRFLSDQHSGNPFSRCATIQTRQTSSSGLCYEHSGAQKKNSPRMAKRKGGSRDRRRQKSTPRACSRFAMCRMCVAVVRSNRTAFRSRHVVPSFLMCGDRISTYCGVEIVSGQEGVRTWNYGSAYIFVSSCCVCATSQHTSHIRGRHAAALCHRARRPETLAAALRALLSLRTQSEPTELNKYYRILEKSTFLYGDTLRTSELEPSMHQADHAWDQETLRRRVTTSASRPLWVLTLCPPPPHTLSLALP